MGVWERTSSLISNAGGPPLAATANFLAPTIAKLEILRNEERLSFATGFFLKREGSWYLVSNWHVFSGRSPLTGQSLQRTGATPTHCRFFTVDLTGNGLVREPHLFPLGDPHEGNATWFEHPVLYQDVDVGVLPLGDVVPGKAKDLLDPTGHDETMWIDLGGELFVPGYPLGLEAPAGLAIWKRASLATSTEFGEGMNRKVLVDTASREGMSGSPCLAIANWRYYSLDRATGKMKVVDRPLSHRLLGVYSGRLNAKDELGAQLGIVWRENLIFETLAGKCTATVQLRSLSSSTDG
jgi:hypothetical protein